MEKGYLPPYHAQLPPCFLEVSTVIHEIQPVEWFGDSFTSFSRASLSCLCFCGSDHQENVAELCGSVDMVEARRVGGSWKPLEALVGSGTKLRMYGMWEGELPGGFAHSFPETRGKQ